MPRHLAHYCFNPAMAHGRCTRIRMERTFSPHLAYPTEGMELLQGDRALAPFHEHFRETTVFPNFYDGAIRRIHPLASFSYSEDWVEHPYQDGVALVGDAAATSIRSSDRACL
jgi:menaquinone-9 beta-reductase